MAIGETAFLSRTPTAATERSSSAAREAEVGARPVSVGQTEPRTQRVVRAVPAIVHPPGMCLMRGAKVALPSASPPRRRGRPGRMLRAGDSGESLGRAGSIQTSVWVPPAQLCPEARGCPQQSCGERGVNCNPGTPSGQGNSRGRGSPPQRAGDPEHRGEDACDHGPGAVRACWGLKGRHCLLLCARGCCNIPGHRIQGKASVCTEPRTGTTPLSPGWHPRQQQCSLSSSHLWDRRGFIALVLLVN